MDSSGIKEKIMHGICRHMCEDVYGEPEEYLNENNIEFVKVNSYVDDADSKGYSQHVIFEVKIDQPFYFIYEWFGGRWESEPARIYLAEPQQVVRFEPVSENLIDKFYEDSRRIDVDD